MIKLYDFELSGNCYKVRLLLSLLGLEWEPVTVDLMHGEERTREFLRLNPRAQVPVLTDGDLVIWDSQAILVYLARHYGDASWLPDEAASLAAVQQWLAVAGNEVLYGLARTRAILKFRRPGDLDDCRAMGARALDLLEKHLDTREWLALERRTVADVACYPYVALAGEGGFDLHARPAIRRWFARVRKLPGYVGMPGLYAEPA
ncbi:MAG: glutathione S-transferase [Gammaproteobacteria bacterium]|jgi:glutathione S-transferase